jgi:hypothetical protein
MASTLALPESTAADIAIAALSRSEPRDRSKRRQ